MKSIFLVPVALAAMSAPLAAADLAMKYPIKAVVAPVFSWTGFYIGGNVGYGGNSNTASASLFDATDASTLLGYEGTGAVSLTSSGFFVGGQIGYNYQFSNNVVLGLETDLQWSGIEARLSGQLLDPSTVLTASAQAGVSLDYFGTIRARLGYAIDRFLPYITGGAAYGRTVASSSAVMPGVGFSGSSAGASSWGWTLGAGGEYAVTNNWTFKAEYLYVDLGSVDYAVFEPLTTTAALGSYDVSFHTFKAGVNYKF